MRCNCKCERDRVRENSRGHFTREQRDNCNVDGLSLICGGNHGKWGLPDRDSYVDELYLKFEFIDELDNGYKNNYTNVNLTVKSGTIV